MIHNRADRIKEGMFLFLSFQPPEARPVIRLVLEHGRAVLASADDLSADRQAWESAPSPSTRGGLGLAFSSEPES
jgi:hypothetical protein